MRGWINVVWVIRRHVRDRDAIPGGLVVSFALPLSSVGGSQVWIDRAVLERPGRVGENGGLLVCLRGPVVIVK